MSIPRIIHHVWPGSDAMPDRFVAARQAWIDRHPGWDFRLWRPEDLTWLRHRRLFDRADTFAQKSDIARYEVVHRFGGVYLDTDMECLRPLDDLVDGCEFFAAREDEGTVFNAVFGATPDHPILRQTIERLPAAVFFHADDEISIQTGPGLFDRVVKEKDWLRLQGVRILPSAYFCPYGWAEPWRRDGPFPRALGVHRWNFSWKNGKGLRVSLMDLLPRRAELVAPALAAAWREGRNRVAEGRRRQVGNVKLFILRTARRILPPPPRLHGLPWGPGEVLVSTPSHTRLLCPMEDLSLSPELAIQGTYDPTFVTFLERRLEPGMTVVDVGANIGLFTIVSAARVGRGGRVFAYECNPELISFLQRNIEMNWFDDRVQLIARAAHRDNEERRFQVPRGRKALGSLTRFAGREDRERDIQEFHVRCERLDVALAGVPYIDLLKIDVEGGEAAVIDGASRLLDEGRIGAISLEYLEDALREELREEMDRTLTSLVKDRGATLHVPGDPRSIPLDEVFTVFEYAQLLIRFPSATIEP